MRLLKNRTFTTKLVIIFIVTVQIPLILGTMSSYYLSKQSLQQKTNDYLHNLSSVIVSKVDDSVNGIEDIIFNINGNATIQRTLQSEKNESRAAIYRNYEESKTILSYYTMLRDEVISIYVQSNQNMIYSYSKTRRVMDFSNVLDMAREDEYEWGMNNQSLFLTKILHNYLIGESLGRIAVEVDPGVFYNIIKETDYSGSGAVYLINDDGIIIAGKESYMIGNSIPKDYQVVIRNKSGIYHNINIGKEKSSVYISDPISNGWRLILTVPSAYYMSDIIGLRNQTLLILLLSMVIAILLIALLSRSVTKPLRQLSKMMEEVGQGNFKTNYIVDSNDEIGALSKTFNQMVKDMEALINREYEAKVMLQSAEMKSLQMQINPHFLYNTLDTINWMARTKGIEDIGNMTSALGRLMRYSLSEKEIVTIREEIDNLKNYIEIQDVRYGDRMIVKFDIPEEVKGYYIPKLLIQPILENAIVHGVESKIDDTLIQVSIVQKDEELNIIVEDDGGGMTQYAVEVILSDKKEQRHGHTSIGVNNVNRRIQNLYGNKYGLMIQSELGAGTKITLRLNTSRILPSD